MLVLDVHGDGLAQLAACQKGALVSPFIELLTPAAPQRVVEVEHHHH